MGVSKNSGTPKWMVYKGKPYKNGCFWGENTSIFGSTPIFSCKTGWCSTPTQLLICSSFNRENGHPLLICSSRFAQPRKCWDDLLVHFLSKSRWPTCESQKNGSIEVKRTCAVESTNPQDAIVANKGLYIGIPGIPYEKL